MRLLATGDCSLNTPANRNEQGPPPEELVGGFFIFARILKLEFKANRIGKLTNR
jgi:hypothetical protein